MTSSPWGPPETALRLPGPLCPANGSLPTTVRNCRYLNSVTLHPGTEQYLIEHVQGGFGDLMFLQYAMLHLYMVTLNSRIASPLPLKKSLCYLCDTPCMCCMMFTLPVYQTHCFGNHKSKHIKSNTCYLANIAHFMQPLARHTRWESSLGQMLTQTI